MRKLLRYLKPFWWIVILIVGLTFAQVQTELSLPDYMSNIVTNGIQYGGVENATPLVVEKTTMDHYLIFMDDSVKEEVLSHYELLNSGQEAVVSGQSVVFKNDVYYLKDEVKLDDYFIKPIVYVSLIDNDENSASIYETIATSDAAKDELIIKLDEATSSYADNLSSAAISALTQEYKQVGVNTEVLQTDYILYTGLEMLGISLLGVICQISSTYLATMVACKVAKNLRHDVFSKVESFSSAEFSRFSSSSLITRTTNDIQQVQMLIQMMLRIILIAPMMGIVSVLKVFRYPDLLWLLLVAIAVISLAMIITLLVAMPRFKKIQSLVDRLNKVMQEFLEGILVIRAFNYEKREEDRFDLANKALSKINLFVSRAMSVMMPFMMFVMNALTVLIIWFGAEQININAMSVGEMMAFIQYAMNVLMSFMIVAMIWIMVPRSLVSAERIFEVLDMESSINDIEKPQSFPENGELCFADVSFKYPKAEEYVLKNISFSAKPGETVAFIGSTGSGKSTLIKLIPRLFDVSEGRISIGDVDIRDMAQEDLREHIGYVPQKALLFTGTIESNIKFGKEVSDDRLNRAIEISQSSNIIAEKDEGLESPIVQGGTNVSGGQKQRLSIARALVKDAAIYIFDDSFSALDYQTDKRLREGLSKMIAKTKAMVLIVAQRISTIKNADKIIVLSDGEIVGMGKHEDLLKHCAVYQEIAKSQLSEEELANV